MRSERALPPSLPSWLSLPLRPPRTSTRAANHSRAAARAAMAPTATAARWGRRSVERLTARDDQQLRQLIRHRRAGARHAADRDAAARWMTSSSSCAASNGARRAGRSSATAVRTTDGKTLDGQLMGEGFDDMQVLTDDKRVHLLRRAGEPLSRGHVAERLADLQRRPARQPLHHDDSDQQGQRRAAGAEMGLHDSRRRQLAGHAGRRRRHHVRRQSQRVLRARCGHRPADLALSAAAFEGANCGARQPRRQHRRRPAVHGHRRRASAGAEPVHRRAAVGHHDGRLAQELLGDLGAAASRATWSSPA